MKDLGVTQKTMHLNCDNVSAISTAKSTAIHERTKLIDVRHHVLRELIQQGTLTLNFVPTAMQADALTKTSTKHAIQKFIKWHMETTTGHQTPANKKRTQD
ncbi:hypothetical protein AeRB84_011582 [Aphanomyces euteiches]|nr:hypothetical protein AeRB84_011582 [Aphanomyces euteiches]